MVTLRNSRLRYIEISRRNPITKILVGSGSSCDIKLQRVCDDICIDIRRAGSKKCNHNSCNCYDTNDCCNNCACNDPCQQVMTVCALEIDEDGYAIFEWPTELYDFKEGWYEGHVYSGCSECGVLPIRIGPRCNVLEVEYAVVGPDSACWITCDDEKCSDDVCKPKTSNVAKNVYNPDYGN